MTRVALLLMLTLIGGGPLPTGAEATPPTGASGPPPQPNAFTLEECYRMALAQSETIAIQQEVIVEAEGRFQQVLSGLRPRVGFSYSYQRQDDSGGGGGTRGLFVQGERQDSKFTATQPLFSGFKEFAAIKAAEAEGRARASDKIRAEQLLFQDVVDAFYLLVEQQYDVAALETTRATLTQRIKELRERERLGRSRRSEAVSAEAQLARLEAEMELVRGQEATARELLEFLTGRSPLGPIADAEAGAPALASVDDYLARADSRPDVRAAEENWRAAEQSVRVARSQYWPTVGLEGNYYTQRPGILEGVHWDAALKFDLPLYHGGQTTGAVKESAARGREAGLRLAQTTRAARLEIRDAHAKVQAALARAAALDKASKAAEESYRLQEQEYRRSLVNNLDVLQALRELQDTRRDSIRAQQEAKRLYRRLLAATGDAS